MVTIRKTYNYEEIKTIIVYKSISSPDLNSSGHQKSYLTDVVQSQTMTHLIMILQYGCWTGNCIYLSKPDTVACVSIFLNVLYK